MLYPDIPVTVPASVIFMIVHFKSMQLWKWFYVLWLLDYQLQNNPHIWGTKQITLHSIET
ncbi:hypothetical protein ACZ11_11265 [Lysinibacillus xylanilyticus]|uniref:Uncharacterized protein n=1 Tax=Lysinibacillus xylanilyticus TaxID=582475 RepID=A0A0K9FDV7_9BACI|nr:hypothetical protein ACZ11_11265 [Lysinibacillus xylanilyticus]